MGLPVVHFEIIGKDPARLRRFYGELFGWTFDTSGPVAAEVSVPNDYGFINPPEGAAAIPGGIGGGSGFAPHVIFYVGVPSVAAVLQRAEALGAERRMGPVRSPGNGIVVGQFADPEGNLIGVAGGE